MKKAVKTLIFFFSIKTFLTGLLINSLKTLVSMTLCYYVDVKIFAAINMGHKIICERLNIIYAKELVDMFKLTISIYLSQKK